MSSVLKWQTSSAPTPAATEPVTLAGKLELRDRELEPLLTRLAAYDNDKAPDGLRQAVVMAGRRFIRANKRKRDAEERLALLEPGSTTFARLCTKLYGTPTPSGPHVNVYWTGTLAYLDNATFDAASNSWVTDLVPCKVTKISAESVAVKITADRPGYPKGDTQVTAHRDVIPRDRVTRARSRQPEIRPAWIWSLG